MKSIIEIRSDRRGISTLLIAVIIVIIVVAIVAVAAFVIFSGNSSNHGATEPPNGGGGIIAPGTTVSGEFSSASGTYMSEHNYIGQNADNYFVEETNADDPPYYYLEPKDNANNVPTGAVKVGDDTIDTKFGPKDVEIWEYTQTQDGSSMFTKAYVDPTYKWLVYLGEITDSGGNTTTYTLQDYNIVLQTSYSESNAIGKTYQYSFLTGTYTFPAYVTCIADCLNGQYGMMYDFSKLISGEVIYYLSDNIQGLPVDAYTNGETSKLTGTIDGDVSVQIWYLKDIQALSFYYESKSHVIYEIVITPPSGSPAVFSLVKKA